MDAKALAKSKRAHSQHHSKKPHPIQASKVTSVAATSSAGNAKKPSGKQTRGKTGQFHGSSTGLPSNWDRYDEELDSGSEDLSIGSTIRASDVVEPKSKGSDFRYLISEAQSQLQSQSDPSFDDILPDFNQGVSSMLSVRGKRILSWTRSDNFIVEDNATASYEASFLSMDLHALAEQLAKVDISQRLFIEPDLLPPELNAERSKESNTQESDHAEATHESGAAIHSLGRADGEKAVDYKNDVTPATIANDHLAPLLPHQGTIPVNPAKYDSRRLGLTDQSEVSESMARIDLEEKKPSNFEAATAEAELDMLLDSFGDSKFLDSSVTEKPSNSFPVLQRESSTSFLEPPLIQAQNVSNILPTVDLNDAIDDLLSETSDTRNQNNVAKHQQEKAAPPDPPHSTSVGSGSNSIVLDDFDSWLDTI